MDSLFADLRYAVRRLLNRPGFTLTALLTMALGIGANSAIFSIVNAVLLRPLPVESPGDLVEIYSLDGDEEFLAPQSYPDYLEIRDRDDLYSGAIGYAASFLGMSVGRRSEVVFGESVSGNYFEVLGIGAYRGRVFISGEDDAPGAPPVVVISHGLWKRRFASDPNIVGQTLTLKGRRFEIIGVTPPTFTGMYIGLAPEVFVPLTAELSLSPGGQQLYSSGSRWILVKGRLQPGVSAERAQAGMDVLAQQLAEAHPETNEDRAFKIVPTSDVRLHPMIDRALQPVAALLMVVVGLVLLIACMNLANLLLARALGRRKEVAIRLAMGARRGRLVRQLLTESMLLALAGGALALLIAYWTASFLVTLQPPILVSLSLDLGVDGRVLVFTLLVSCATGIVFGLAPALQATKPDVVPTLKDEVVALKSRYRHFGLRNSLVVAQIAVSLVLLIGAGLFVRSLMSAQHIDPGFERERAVIMTLGLEFNDYDRARGEEFYRRLVERVAGLPGVESVTMASRLPLGIALNTEDIYVEGSELLPDEAPEVDIVTVSSGYFETMGVPLSAGRDFGARDHVTAPPVVIVSEAAARLFWPGEEAIGKRLRMSEPDGALREVVGIARDTKVRTLGEEPRPYVYEPLQQNYRGIMSLVTRTSADPRSLLPALRREVEVLDESLPIMELKTMSEHLGIMLFAPRVGGILLAIFGGLAVLLASIGLYGVVAYAASQRTRELGIRLALGARSGDVVKLVTGQGMALIGVGTAIGLALAFLLTRPLGGLLYGVGPSDPLAFVGVTLLLAAVALAATLVPALRAMRIDPMAALRHE